MKIHFASSNLATDYRCIEDLGHELQENYLLA